MWVALAYPYEGHAPDSVIEVEDWVGRSLITDGKARNAAQPAPEDPSPKVRKPAPSVGMDEGESA